MKPLEFADLARLQVVEFYEEAFRKATGVSLRVAPPGEPSTPVSFGKGENPLCVLLNTTSCGCAACLDSQQRAHRTVGKQTSAHQINCFAGLTEVALPVQVEGRHVATLMSGQVFRREPTERDFKMLVNMVGAGQGPDWERKTRQAYFETPVVTAERFEAIVQLLHVFAQYLSDHASRMALANVSEEPPAIATAKQYVHEHVEEPFTLSEVVRHVNMSRFYFCKLFRKSTGMTLTDYVARVRVEKAKSLLVDRSMRVSEIVFAAGFGSIPQFNSVFKRLVGMPPTEYRESLRSDEG